MMLWQPRSMKRARPDSDAAHVSDGRAPPSKRVKSDVSPQAQMQSLRSQSANSLLHRSQKFWQNGAPKDGGRALRFETSNPKMTRIVDHIDLARSWVATDSSGGDSMDWS